MKTAETKKPKKTNRSGVPLSLRLDPETGEKLLAIAKKNGLSKNALSNLCIAAGLNFVDGKLDQIRDGDLKAA